MIFGEKTIQLKGRNCECSICKETLAKRKKVLRKTWLRFGFFFKLALTASLWYLWYLTAIEISKIKPLKTFDPYQILGVEPGTEMA